jgi:LemA protein
MEPWMWWLIGGGGVVVLVVLFVVFTYNGLVARKLETGNAWSQISVQLQRRHDLIPNLVETVKGYAHHEQDTLQKVIQARNQAVSATSVPDKVQAENQLTAAMRGLLAVAEAYPDLKANQNFLALQEELTATENRIGFARQHYNDAVGQFNQALMQFPGNIVAGMFGFKPAEFFNLDPAEAAAVKQVPKVQF